MAEVSYVTKTGGPVTLRSGRSKDDGSVTIEIWYENRVIASLEIEYVWDFLADVFAENSMKRRDSDDTVVQNYRDKGSRAYCMAAAQWLRSVLYEGSPHLHEVMEMLQRLVVTRSPNEER